jgi:acyl carrier protein
VTPREAAIAAEIRRIAREELSIAADPAPGEELAAQLDSLALLSLVVAVEDRFLVILDDADAAGTRSLEDLAQLVVRKLDGGGGGRLAAAPEEGR